MKEGFKKGIRITKLTIGFGEACYSEDIPMNLSKSRRVLTGSVRKNAVPQA